MFRAIDDATQATILKQAKEDGRPIAEISNEFKVSPKTIYGWL
jgi:transposase-like protein